MDESRRPSERPGATPLVPRFTERVRSELAHAPLGSDRNRLAETSAVVRLGGALHRSGAAADGAGWVVTLATNAVARRLHAALVEVFGARPEVEVHRPTGLRATSYRLHLARPVEPVLRTLGILGADGRPLPAPPAALTLAEGDAAAYLRGALMAAGSVSDPRRPPHLELRVPGQPAAVALLAVVRRCGGAGASVARRPEGWRVSCKSGAAIGAVLARVGAHGAFLAWDDERLRRELRGEANRAANADRANLGRAADAAARQVTAIEAAVARLGWDALGDDLRSSALARLANPEASLAELADLHDPAVSKATVHRRLARLAALGDPPQRPGGAGGGALPPG